MIDLSIVKYHCQENHRHLGFTTLETIDALIFTTDADPIGVME